MTLPQESTLATRADDRADNGPSTAMALSFAVVLFGIVGVIALVVALVVGTSDSGSTTATTSSGPAAVTLTEFAIAPATITADAAAGLHVTNGGTVQHNLSV